MQCKGQTAKRIEKTFTTAEQLIEAVESDQPLTERDGIGPKTAETINEWWNVRFERERKMDSSEFERTGKNTASIHFHASWKDALGMHTDTDAENTDEWDR